MRAAAAAGIAVILAVAMAAGMAFAAKQSAPKSASVGDLVTTSANGLKPGRYAVTLTLDHTAGPRTACVSRLGHLQDTVKGRVKITGKIPRRLTCWENDSVRLGRVRTTPGSYHLIVAVPDGPSGFNGKYSFVRRAFKITG
jgi:hypothetical protein